jgi:hypothetical protein
MRKRVRPPLPKTDDEFIDALREVLGLDPLPGVWCLRNRPGLVDEGFIRRHELARSQLRESFSLHGVRLTGDAAGDARSPATRFKSVMYRGGR